MTKRFAVPMAFFLVVAAPAMAQRPNEGHGQAARGEEGRGPSTPRANQGRIPPPPQKREGRVKVEQERHESGKVSPSSM